MTTHFPTLKFQAQMTFLTATLIAFAPAVHAEPREANPGGAIRAPAEATATISGHFSAETIAQSEARIRSGISSREPWVGIIGDSGITGAATGLDLQPNAWSLGALIAQFLGESRRTVQLADPSRVPGIQRFGINDEKRLSPLVRVVYSQDEFRRAAAEGRRYEKNLEAKGSLRLDIPEYSFAYLTARALGVPAHRVVLAAQDGRQIGAITEQLQRLGEVSDAMPSLLLMSFTANDLCGDELAGPLADFRASFKAQARMQLRQMIQRFRAHPGLGTRVVILAPLDVAQILTNPDLLAQRINFQGRGDGEVTCRDLREQRAAQSDLGHQMQNALISMCRSILPTRPDDALGIQKIRDFQSAQIEVWREAIAETAAEFRLSTTKPGPGEWSLEFIESVRDPRFSAGDLANDCFHPGPAAHAKIAEALLRRLR